MRSQSITFLAAAVLFALAASPALAQFGGPNGGPGGNGNGGPDSGGPNNGGGGGGIGAPGPVAGAGLGYLVLAGGYYVVRRWRKPKSGE
jgi:hypothetical protein